MRTLPIVVAVVLSSLNAGAGERPPVTVADAELGCPGLSGAFVSVLDPDRGMLLLSSTGFIGGSRVARPDGRIIDPWLERWNLDTLSAPVDAEGVFAAVYPFLGDGGGGCVAFDKQRFSSEGDLASYLRWLAEEIYLGLPEAERRAYPAFALRDRAVALTVKQPGYKPMSLTGKEGAYLAFRVAGEEGTFLLLPFILDAESRRLAVKLFHTTEPFWQRGDKRFLRWLILDPATPVELGEQGVTVATEAEADDRDR